MKMFLAAVALGIGFGGAAFADPVEGVWKTQVDDGAYAHVQVSACGAALCGVIARTFNDTGEYKSDNIGKKLVISEDLICFLKAEHFLRNKSKLIAVHILK